MKCALRTVLLKFATGVVLTDVPDMSVVVTKNLLKNLKDLRDTLIPILAGKFFHNFCFVYPVPNTTTECTQKSEHTGVIVDTFDY